MKSLNDYIWNDEDIELSEELKTSSARYLVGDNCEDRKFAYCPDFGYVACEEIPTPKLSVCEFLDPIKIYGCIVPMGVSCGGGTIDMSTPASCPPFAYPDY